MPADEPTPQEVCIFTIGHSTRSFGEVLEMVRANGITLLADIRSFPGSRAHPQWKQQAVIDALPDDIGYEWLRDLGGRRHTPAGVESANGGWRVKAFRDYGDYMATPEFSAGLDHLIDLAGHHVVAIMCSEAVPWRCHRRMVTDALLVRGVQVRHIMSATSTKPAEMTDFLHVEDGLITYPAPDVQEELPGEDGNA